MRSRYLILSLLLFLFNNSYSQNGQIRIHFLYGSKPAVGYKETESKLFGGLKGGHVNIELNGKFLDFMPGNCPLFPVNKKPTGGFSINHSVYWDTLTSRWSTVIVPVDSRQLKELEMLFEVYAEATPYDYAVFGMRCAAASYDVLSEVGLMKKLNNRNNIIKHFYPKLLRKKIYKWARKNHYEVIHRDGRVSRKWERDKGLF
jgi:hypothetical protein